MCYAYRDTDSEELLLDHLMNVAKCCQNRWEFKALSSKISRLLDLDEGDVRYAIVLASLLHDIGKAVESFQEECSRGKCAEFPKHYLISMFLTHFAFRASGISLEIKDVLSFIEDRIYEIEKEKTLELLIVLPIAFHHYHQVRGYTSYSVYRSNTMTDIFRIFIERPRIWSKCTEGLHILNNIASNRWNTVLQKLQEILPDIERYKDSDLYRGSKLFTENFYSVIEKNVKLISVTLSRTIIESIAGLINLCDGRVAYMARARKADRR